MVLWIVVLMSHCCLGLNAVAAAAAGTTAGLERIEKCGTRCSQGLHCKTKPESFFPPPCESPAEGVNATSTFHNISLSTVMRCEGRQKCSLHLRIKTQLQLTESIHGVSICTVTPGFMANCRIVSFRRASRERMSGLQVEVENDCTEISPSQHVTVTVKTVPSYCGVTWTSTFKAPECSSEDLQRHVPECITGRLSYDVNPQSRELSVTVSDMLEDYNYHVRLCLNDFICHGTAAHILIKKEEPIKSVTLTYPRPLPCLCLQGWSAMMDAPRTQVCPFKDRLEELWSGINFDPLEGTLSWRPACRVAATVVLCQKREDGVCVDLPHASQNVTKEKITYTKVAPHPHLCMKFIAGSQSWTKCPFADTRFQAWEVIGRQGHQDVEIVSQINATFSVALCVKSEEPAECRSAETHTVHVEKHKAIALHLEGKLCNSCLQVTQIDVKFAATVVHCLEQCNQSPHVSPIISSRASWDVTGMVVPAGVFLCGVIISTLVLHVLLTVYQRRKQRPNRGCGSEKQTGLAFVCVGPALQTKPIAKGEVFIPDSECGNSEKTTLICN